jgi:hypothetical protein
MPIFFPPLIKVALGTIGAAAIIHWAVKEARRINDEIERLKAAASLDPRARHRLPTLRRDPGTGVWRIS